MKINLKKKTLFFLFSFLSLFTYEIVNSEQIKDFPYKKGSYLVCANGKAIPTSFWRNLVSNVPFDPSNTRFYNSSWDYNTLNELYRIKKYGLIIEVSSRVIVGKKPKIYSKNEKIAIMKKFLEGVSLPTSYKSTAIGPIDKNGKSWIYKFKNSEEKKLFIRQYYGSGLLVEDNNGNKFKGDTGLNLVMFYCKNDYIVLRAVEEINIYRGQVTNEFNENIKLPTIFWVREFGVEAKPPMMKKNYDF